MIDMVFSTVEHESKTDECKGIFWRGTKNQYLSSHKSIESRNSLRLLKRISCEGCEKCYWMWDYIHEDLCNVTGMLDHIKDGKLYQYKVDVSYDYYYGGYEVDGSEFIEVEENMDE